MLKLRKLKILVEIGSARSFGQTYIKRRIGMIEGAIFFLGAMFLISGVLSVFLTITKVLISDGEAKLYSEYLLIVVGVGALSYVLFN